MKISAFTFLKNPGLLGYPYKESILSALPLVDEFVIALGPCEDDTKEVLEQMQKEYGKIKIINTVWNENIRTDLNTIKGFVYGQQKSIALFNCTGHWAFYLEADEILHENELDKIKNAMIKYKDDDEVEALTFDYIHFYGNKNTYAWSPGWYRREVRVVKNNIPVWGPKGLFFVVLTHNKKGRYPKAAHSGAKIYHYGWVRNEEQMNKKFEQVEKYWSKNKKEIDYTQIDQDILKEFKATHPKVIQNWLPEANGIFKANPNYKLTTKEKRRKLMLKLEEWFGLELSKKHFKLVRK